MFKNIYFYDREQNKLPEEEVDDKEARLADDNGWTALMWAEDTQQADMIKLLAPLEAKM